MKLPGEPEGHTEQTLFPLIEFTVENDDNTWGPEDKVWETGLLCISDKKPAWSYAC